MKAGEVKFFRDQAGFGFIQPQGEDEVEVFFHFSEVRESDRPLRRFDSVEFEMGEDRNGRPSAVKIQKL